MIRGLVEAMLGEAGRSVLYFYEQHAVVLGLIIVAYGILMYLSWQNLVHIYRFLVRAAAETLAGDPDKQSAPAKNGSAKRQRRAAGTPANRRAGRELPWQEAVDSVRFPFVSPRAGLWPIRKSIVAAQKIIDERELWEHARAVAAGADVRRISPAYRLASRPRMETNGKD